MAQQTQQLLVILKNADAPVFDKAKACQRLAIVGNCDAVPALAALLPDETLNSYARFGLEGIPDPAVDVALRDAAAKLSGRPLVGVIGSIGQRQDLQAVGVLQKLLKHQDASVAEAAAGALGQIGVRDAARVLKEQLSVDSPHKLAIADACLTCANRLTVQGDPSAASSLLEAIAKAQLPKHLRIAALSGQFQLNYSATKELLLTQIRTVDEDFFRLGLAAARQLPGAEVTTALVAELEKLPLQRQAMLLLALGDRRDKVPLMLVITASQSPSPELRQAALQVLAESNDSAAADVLLDAAFGDGVNANSARKLLQNLTGHKANSNILARWANAQPPAKAVLLELFGARRIADALPAVQASLTDTDEAVRLAAIGALGKLADLKHLDLLIQPALESSQPAESNAAQAALQTAALRIDDQEGCAQRLAECLKTATGEAQQTYLMELLGQVSGPTALKTVVSSVKSDNPVRKDAATRVLGTWLDAAAAPALLDLAKNDPQGKYRTRALRGYLRIARQLQLPDKECRQFFRSAMEIAERDEEKLLALDILVRIPSAETLKLAVSYVGEPVLKNAATDVALKIAPKLLATDPKAVAEAMQRLISNGTEGDAAVAAKQLLEQSSSLAR